ncbi:hypothetical protein EYC80_008912 [Monilinia laxa]|uniref:PAC domain-containing protein n=1 Tax=Monilinia laxa TaxID=61186 RepID=A0A5N6K2A1_MONLA|nr:hypothetical protein EYC80_008912 [Monilinia laxa]
MDNVEDSENRSQVASTPLESPDSERSQFFDLSPPISSSKDIKIEDLARRLFSSEHLLFILHNHALFQKFSNFITRFKPHLVPTLIRYLETVKAIKAIEYANAVAQKIRWPHQLSSTSFCEMSRAQAAILDVQFDDYSTKELALLVKEALPAWVTYNLSNVVFDCVAKDITGHRVSALQDWVGNLAEVFCLTDPSVHDNPIVYATEEFHRTTQYGKRYAIDHNCRFLQGPGTDEDAVLRMSKAISSGQEVNEVLLNYRRDGTCFINLCMIAPLYDDKGNTRYFIGAQIDVSGLVEEGRGIESFQALLRKDQEASQISTIGGIANTIDPQPLQYGDSDLKDSKFRDRTQEMLGKLHELSNMFGQYEADVLAQSSQLSSRDKISDRSLIRSEELTVNNGRDSSKRTVESKNESAFRYSLSQLNLGHSSQGASLSSVYKNYLLVRPYPSLQIMFVSPSLRLPGLVRTNIFTKLGGSQNTLSALEGAFKDGAAITAKVLWLPKNNSEDNGMMTGIGREVRARGIRCTPLLGKDGRVGVWMVVLVPLEGEEELGMKGQHFGASDVPLTVSESIDRSKEWDSITKHDIGTNTDNGTHRNWYRKTSIHGELGIVIPQYNNEQESCASSSTFMNVSSNAEDPRSEMAASKNWEHEVSPMESQGFGWGSGGYGYGIKKISSPVQLSSWVDDDDEGYVRDGQAGSVQRTQGRLWMDATKGSDAEMYAKYLRSSSTAPRNMSGGSTRASSKMGRRRRKDSGIGEVS